MPRRSMLTRSQSNLKLFIFATRWLKGREVALLTKSKLTEANDDLCGKLNSAARQEWRSIVEEREWIWINRSPQQFCLPNHSGVGELTEVCLLLYEIRGGQPTSRPPREKANPGGLISAMVLSCTTAKTIPH